ncbi:AmmeMemoRadiSam system protein B [Candidatus Woesearchaeota archaeon]|nr:AmmeMemoRadiSam system protein B [Candidatus Woesearchaeota archaeon]MBT5043370.1 AmmeMemoRadiSam system protein B [Candidatus Woesearchaeota archaeon]MBT7786697.1 AmmeMemoRadiSam system protein B [Candidatus Woesearchaeota archaeon]
MNRKPVACPEYYPNTFDKLDKAIRESFTHKKGPGTLQSSRRNINLNLLAFPSESIEKTGPCQAWGYMELAEANFPETYLIIGTNHHSETKLSTYLFADWETPLGNVKINQDVAKTLSILNPLILNEHTAHENEHSVETQLPWLQFASRDKLTDLTFVPLSINLTTSKEITKLAETLNTLTTKHNITIIATHNIEDKATIQYIKSLDAEALKNYKLRRNKDIRNLAPMLTLMELAKLQNKSAQIIDYQASAKKEDKNYYACIKFR